VISELFCTFAVRYHMKSSVRRTVCVIGGLIYGLLCSAWQPHALEEGFQRHALKESMTGSLFASDKLSGGLITCVCQDRYGFIWVGTEYGLNKFDGYRFTTYFHSRQDSATLVDNEISTIYMDRQGRLWVGCSKGLTCYDYEHDNFLLLLPRRKQRSRLWACCVHRCRISVLLRSRWLAMSRWLFACFPSCAVTNTLRNVTRGDVT